MQNDDVKYCSFYGSFYTQNNEWFSMNQDEWKGYQPDKPPTHPDDCHCLKKSSKVVSILSES